MKAIDDNVIDWKGIVDAGLDATDLGKYLSKRIDLTLDADTALDALEMSRYLRNKRKFTVTFNALKTQGWKALHGIAEYGVQGNIAVAREIGAPPVEIKNAVARQVFRRFGIGYSNTITAKNIRGTQTYRILADAGSKAAVVLQVAFQVVGIAFG